METMSDSEEENFCFYGKALEQYDEDAFPKKKPISIEDQIATDELGRRRFHGAFTGGFSAGFFNTVGSLEGWRPTEFKSSRGEKAEKKVWKPEDYMDTEDIGEFGIAPQTVKATSDYSTTKKRKKQVFADGPIPGEPVLHTLITSGNETVGYLLMKNMGLKQRTNEQTCRNDDPKTYGCVMPKSYEIKRNNDDEQHLIPEVYVHYLTNPKVNTFGLGYSGLDKSHINLFTSSQLVVRDKNNKKLSISGQAFGVGAFEDDDEDIYAKDDMTKYDFELTAEAKKKKKQESNKSNYVFDDFVLIRTPLAQPEKFPPPNIPHSFSGKHNVKKSRFEPIPEEPVARKNMDASVRARHLGEESFAQGNKATQPIPSGSKTEDAPSDLAHEDLVKVEPENDAENLASGLFFGRFVSATQKENPHDILESVERSETEHGTKEMRDAAKLNMFGPLTRITIDWKPCSLLCKRFNVPEPMFDLPKRDARRKTAIIFEYQKNNAPEVTLEPGLTSKAAETDKVLPPETVVDEKENLEQGANIGQPKSPRLQPLEGATSESVTVPDPTQKIDVSKNIDLFKAVFLSSSESEPEDEAKDDVEEEEEEEQSRNDLIKTNVLSDHLIPKIRTNKEGILSNIGHKFNPMFRSVSTKSREDTGEVGVEGDAASDRIAETVPEKFVDPHLYGPKLPEKIERVEKAFAMPKIAVGDEKWVEKDIADNKKSHKHKKKKHKKDKRHKREHKAKCRN